MILAATCFGSRRNHHQGKVICIAKSTKWVFCARRYRRSQCYGGISPCGAGVRFRVETFPVSTVNRLRFEPPTCSGLCTNNIKLRYGYSFGRMEEWSDSPTYPKLGNTRWWSGQLYFGRKHPRHPNGPQRRFGRHGGHNSCPCLDLNPESPSPYPNNSTDWSIVASSNWMYQYYFDTITASKGQLL